MAAVLSGNRNFEGRVDPLVRSNYLASPPLVVAYAIAGKVDLDLTKDPLGTNAEGEKIYLKDVWPSAEEWTRQSERQPVPSFSRKSTKRFSLVMSRGIH